MAFMAATERTADPSRRPRGEWRAGQGRNGASGGATPIRRATGRFPPSAAPGLSISSWPLAAARVVVPVQGEQWGPGDDL